MSDLRQRANAAAQAALRASNEYLSRHGHRDAALDATYEAAERVMDAIDEYEATLERAHDAAEDAEFAPFIPGPFYLPDVPLADPGDWFVGVGR